MKTPKAPDPVKTAEAQGAVNKETAIAQQQLNMVNQTGPYGSTQYRQIGTYSDGTPRFEQITTLDPAQQGLLNQQNQLSGALNDFALGQTDRISDALSTPFSLDQGEAIEGRLLDLGRKRLDPLLAQRQDAARTRLANQGITQGSEAWNREMERLSQAENDAYNSLLLSGRGQALQEILTERNQPINEIGALMGGGQVTMPQFGATPQSGIASPDLMGATYNNYNQQLAARNAAMGGLFGLGGAALGGWAGTW